MLPAYIAEMVCDPILRDDVSSRACPAPFSAAVPMVVVPSRNTTVPVGAGWDPLPVGVTVAVKTRVCPKAEGLTDEMRAVVVALFDVA